MENAINPEKLTLTNDQLMLLHDRLSNNNLSDDDLANLQGVLSFNIWLQEQLESKKLSIRRLKSMFGFKSESLPKQTCDNEDNNIEQDDDLVEQNYSNRTSKPNRDPGKNHGRLSAASYTGCTDVPISFDDNQSHCPDCALDNTQAKLYMVEPQFIVRLTGKPIVQGFKYEVERARCQVCQTYFSADVPESITSQEKYDVTCNTSIAIYHYYAGLPFKRIEMLQAAQGIPLPDSTQFDLMSNLYRDVISHIVAALRNQAANGESILYDDTSSKVLDQIQINKQASTKADKATVHATALISEYSGHRIYLFDTNTDTAGKQFKELISQRTIDGEFQTMTDALPSNFPEIEESLMSRWVISLCLAHARRRFVELLNDDDQDVKFVLENIGAIYENDRICYENKLSPAKRLDYHKKNSAPILDSMWAWLNNLIQYKEVEPNSQFGDAILYMLKRWECLTQFVRVEGARLDNNICEQAVKVLIRYRKNSLFFKTFYGASVGDGMMSVMHTAYNSGVNIFKYLNCLQINSKAVQENPEDWVPWKYQETLSNQKIDSS